MSRRERRNTESYGKENKFILLGIILVVVLAFVASYVIYSKAIANRTGIRVENSQVISKTSDNKMINLISNTQEVTSSIGKSVNEIKNNAVDETHVAVNTSKQEEKNNQADVKKNSKNKEVKSTEGKNTEITENKANEEEKDPSFKAPVEGEKQKDFSKDNLIYSETLQEWAVHNGIDYSAEKTDVVKAAADGKVKSIKNDPRYGLTVVIEHKNGFESIYSSLLTAEFINVGEEVKQGQTIATVGNTATFEIADNTHLHFELKKDGENVDPNIYLK